VVPVEEGEEKSEEASPTSQSILGIDRATKERKGKTRRNQRTRLKK